MPLTLCDDGFALFGREQQTRRAGDAAGVVPIDLGVGDLHLRRRERLDVVVGLLDLGSVERELRAFLQEERRWNVHVLFRKLDRHRCERHLRIHELQFALHRFDFLAHPAEFLFHLEQIGHVLALRFQNLDQALLHQSRVLQPRFRVEIGLRHVFGGQRLVLELADSAQFSEEPVEIIRQNFHHDFAAQFPVLLLFGAGRRDVAFLFRSEGGDLLDRFIEAGHFQFCRRVADQFPVRAWAGDRGRRTRRIPRRLSAVASLAEAGAVFVSWVQFSLVLGSRRLPSDLCRKA